MLNAEGSSFSIQRSGFSVALLPPAEGICEYIVRDAITLSDPLRLVERPVDAEIDAALAVLLLGLRQATRSCAAAAAGRCPSLSRVTPLNSSDDEREGDVVGAVEVAQRLEQRAAEAGVARRIGGERRREVRARAGCWPARRAA